ncbi:hypothetical protein GCT13_46620 [Paraburkholderia sp. CNPSo 3157]|uniref:Uncharacterized protein n=1 Tax=Paraburkholderia franconis TaxID=2654983 RepID=A0A7X1TLY4_9BURK|nr:hypothetical protein [Paraburkholderia franconis]MPW23954.1 hypothetical protein [Paraburkholderia franconis]
MQGIPHYLVLRAGYESYVLDRERVLIRRQASRMMNWFARAHGKPMSIVDAHWDSFSREYGFSSDERKCLCAYSLVEGSETRHQLALLANL